MVQPPGFTQKNKDLVCKLNKALYRLKQAHKAWYDKLTQAPLLFGFTHSKCDHSLFIYFKQGIIIYSLVYVDDILLTDSSSQLV